MWRTFGADLLELDNLECGRECTYPFFLCVNLVCLRASRDIYRYNEFDKLSAFI